MICQYTNFDITISGSDAQPSSVGGGRREAETARYPVFATYRGLSGASTFNQDLRHPVWNEYLTRLSDPYGTQGEELLTEIGSRLFSELVRGQVRDLWSQARSDVDDGSRVRLRLVMHPAAVAALPWEALHDPRRNQTLAAEGRISLVRTQNLVSFVARPRPLQAELPLSVLLVTVDAHDGPSMHSESEEVEEVIARLPSRPITLECLGGRVTFDQLRERLVAGGHDVLHVVGHGNEDGLLLWADNVPALAPSAALRAVMQEAGAVKLAILSACQAGQVDGRRPFAGLAHQLLQSGLPAVVAMRYEIPDRSAVSFARSVYEGLVSGPCRGTIDAAVSLGRSRLYVDDPGRVDYAIPSLWLNAESGRILSFADREAVSERPVRRTAAPRPQMWSSSLREEFRLAEKEGWYRSMPETVPDSLLAFEFQRRRRITGLLLGILRKAVDEQEQGKVVDIRSAQKRLETFDEERRHIQNILDHCLDLS